MIMWCIFKKAPQSGNASCVSKEKEQTHLFYLSHTHILSFNTLSEYGVIYNLNHNQVTKNIWFYPLSVKTYIGWMMDIETHTHIHWYKLNIKEQSFYCVCLCTLSSAALLTCSKPPWRPLIDHTPHSLIWHTLFNITQRNCAETRSQGRGRSHGEIKCATPRPDTANSPEEKNDGRKRDILNLCLCLCAVILRIYWNNYISVLRPSLFPYAQTVNWWYLNSLKGQSFPRMTASLPS